MTTIATQRKRGSKLRVGDTISIWFAGGRGTITELEPYSGPLAYLWKDGAQIAKFAQSRLGMTIGINDIADVF